MGGETGHRTPQPLPAGDLPLDAGHSQPLLAAFAYYVEDLSQAEIAERLKVSRATVHNYLRQARDEGLVRITLDPAIAARSAMAGEIAERFGLQSVYLVPAEGESARLAVPRAAAMWLDELTERARSLGVAWGETVHRLASLLPARSRPDLTVVQLVGSMTLPFRFTAESCSSLIAERFGAKCLNLHAPAVLSDPALVAALCAEPVIAAHRARIETCEAALFAIGLSNPESHVVQSGVVNLDVLAHYQERGAAAVVAGHFIDASGHEIAGPLDGRLIGVDLQTLRTVPRRIVVSAGRDRADALSAALAGGFATHLVTDIASARHLLR